MKTTRNRKSFIEKKTRSVSVVIRRLLKIRENFEKEWTDGAVRFLMWAGGGIGAFSLKIPEPMPETAILLAIVRRTLRDVNKDLAISELSCQSTGDNCSLQFSYRRVNYRDQ